MSQRSAPVMEALAAVERHPPTGFGAPDTGPDTPPPLT